MKCVLQSTEGEKRGFLVSDCSREELDSAIILFFTSQGYTLKKEDDGLLTFTRGNRVLRILFGAFVKYSRISLGVEEASPRHFVVLLNRDSSGMSGGLIGMNQVKKEFNKMTLAFEQHMNGR